MVRTKMNKKTISTARFWGTVLVLLSFGSTSFAFQSEDEGPSALEQATEISKATGKPLFVVAGAAT